MKMINNLVSLRAIYFISIGNLKTGGQGGGLSEPPELPLDPPLESILSIPEVAGDCITVSSAHSLSKQIGCSFTIFHSFLMFLRLSKVDSLHICP